MSFEDTVETTADPGPTQDDAADRTDADGLTDSPTSGLPGGTRDGTGRTVVEARDGTVWYGDTQALSDITLPSRNSR
jgi:hypothetical protein